jgi:hypothetical protein
VALGFGPGRKRAAFVFGYRDRRNYRELLLFASGRYQLAINRNGRRKIVKRGAFGGVHGMPVFRLVISGTAVRCTEDGTEFMSGDVGTATAGRVGVMGLRGSTFVDDVRVLGY